MIRRLAAPDGDRRHCPESCRVVDEIAAVERDNDVVGVFVLGENRLDVNAGRLLSTPVEDALQRGLRRDQRSEAPPRGLVEVRVID